MSAFGDALARALAAMGGPAPAAAIIAGGLVVGGLGGGFIAANGSQSVNTTGELPVYACPDTGSPLVKVPGGQRLLATGRTEDATWLRIHYPDPGRNEAWVEAKPLQVTGSIDSLPVAECMPEVLAAIASFEPQPTLTVPGDNAPTPTPTPGVTPTPTPTATPTAEPNSRPDLGSLTVSTQRISFDTGEYCPKAETTATFRVRAQDDAGIASVALFWREPGAGSFARLAMSRSAGGARDGTWSASLDTARNGINQAGSLAYYAQATDTDGATRRLPNSGSDAITVNVCRNEGPDITQVRSSAGSNLRWDPLFVGNCQTATNITASVEDVDGVDTVRLFYRRPGDSGFQSKPMTLTRGKWFANLDTLGDKISIPDPPTGSVRWYIRAVDDKGVDNQTSTATITVRRCDSEAVFDGVFPTNPNDQYPCNTKATITLGTYANDEDQPNGNLKVVFHWELYNRRTQDGPITGQMSATFDKGNYYQATTRPFNGERFYDGFLTAWVVTTDRYGGTTTSPRDTQAMGAFCGVP